MISVGSQAAQGLHCVDLLKVDVERAELDVLEGVAAADWCAFMWPLHAVPAAAASHARVPIVVPAGLLAGCLVSPVATSCFGRLACLE